MFLVDAEAPGIAVRPLEPMAPHPLGELRFEGTPAVLLGAEGKGYKVALATLDMFRPSVGAAACGLAQRAFDEAVRWTQGRRQFGRPLSEFQATQMALAEMQRGARRGAAARVPGRLAQGHGSRSGSPAREPWPSCKPPRRPSGWSTERCSSTGATG